MVGEFVGDLVIDIGKVLDGGKIWVFILCDGVMWDDGFDVICVDIKYGVLCMFV